MQSTFFLGLDLGQAADYSALAILETERAGRDAVYRCRHLQRWPLKTPYPEIVADTLKVVARLEAKPAPALAVDATGVGAPVVDLFRSAFKAGGARLCPVQITGGDAVTFADDLTRVPKRDLVGAAQVALQTGRLKIAAELPDAPLLARELQNFQVEISLETAHDSYGAWREGSHDDLVLAVCLALWTAENGPRPGKLMTW